MITTWITGIIGISLYLGFVGFMVVWVPALPLIIITVGVSLLVLLDFVQTLHSRGSGA